MLQFKTITGINIEYTENKIEIKKKDIHKMS